MFNSKNWFAQSVSPLNQNQFGGYIGGPILKDKLFYFGSYQGTRFSSTNNGLGAYVPNAAERTGDFSDIAPGSPVCQSFGTCVQLVDPVTGVNYPNNHIPVSPVATYLLNKIPLPNGAQLGIPAPPGLPNDNLYYNGLPIVQNTDEYLVKVDYNFAKNHLSGHYFRAEIHATVGSSAVHEHSADRRQCRNVDRQKRQRRRSCTPSRPNLTLGSYYGYTKIDGTTYSGAPFSMVDAGANIALPPSPGDGYIASIDILDEQLRCRERKLWIWNRGEQSLREIAT